MRYSQQRQAAQAEPSSSLARDQLSSRLSVAVRADDDLSLDERWRLASGRRRGSTTMRILSFAFLAIVVSTTTSHARPGKTCAAACNRFSSCKLVPFKTCMQECGRQGAEDSAKGRASNLGQARSSCAALAAELAPSKWICTAQGASVYGYDVRTGPMGDVQGTSSIFITGTGKTRSVAAYDAVDNCNALMSVDLVNGQAMNLDADPRGEWGSAISSECRVTQCWGPPRARRQK